MVELTQSVSITLSSFYTFIKAVKLLISLSLSLSLQVHSLRTGFSPRRSGAHSHTNSESSMDSDLLTPPATAGGPAGRQQLLLHPLHFRGESVPSHLPGPAAAGKSGSLGRVNPSNSHLLDPLVDFTDEELSTESHPARLVGPLDNYRVSMQW